MTMTDGGALFGQALANEGVEKAFGLCGGHIMPIFYGLRNAGIEIIDVRHECAAVYAATAYTRASGKAAVVVTTAGPGVGNTPAGMMEAASLNIPLVQIGGAVATGKRDAGDLQDMSTLALMESCSKWARKLTHTHRIPEYVSMAYREAWAGPPGPVYLEVPTDLVFAPIDDGTVHFPRPVEVRAAPAGDLAALDEAADLLAGAARPAVIVDDGARWTLGDDADAIAALSDYLKMPVGVVGTLCRGAFGNERDDALLTANAIDRADVVLTLGCRFDFRLQSGRSIPTDAKVIQVHDDRRQIGFNLRADVGIVGGAGPVVRQLVERVQERRNPSAAASWSGVEGSRSAADLPAAYHDTKTPTHPARCAGDAARFLEEDARDWTIVNDGGEASVWFGAAATAIRPGQVHATGATGTIGTGPAQVIGAWTADRNPVLWFTGDGSFGFYGMEMETMARLGIPVVCIISNNSSWGMIHMAEKYVRPDEIAEKGPCNVALHPMRAYEKMAGMWDGYGERVTDPEEILPAIRRAADATTGGVPAIVNVEVDDVSLSPFIAGYANMIKPEAA